MKDKFYFMKLMVHVFILLVLNYYGFEFIGRILKMDPSSGFSMVAFLVDLVVIMAYIILNFSKETFYLLILNLFLLLSCMIFYKQLTLAVLILLGIVGVVVLKKLSGEMDKKEINVWGILIVVVWLLIINQLI